MKSSENQHPPLSIPGTGQKALTEGESTTHTSDRKSSIGAVDLQIIRIFAGRFRGKERNALMLPSMSPEEAANRTDGLAALIKELQNIKILMDIHLFLYPTPMFWDPVFRKIRSEFEELQKQILHWQQRQDDLKALLAQVDKEIASETSSKQRQIPRMCRKAKLLVYQLHVIRQEALVSVKVLRLTGCEAELAERQEFIEIWTKYIATMLEVLSGQYPWLRPTLSYLLYEEIRRSASRQRDTSPKSKPKTGAHVKSQTSRTQGGTFHAGDIMFLVWLFLRVCYSFRIGTSEDLTTFDYVLLFLLCLFAPLVTFKLLRFYF